MQNDYFADDVLDVLKQMKRIQGNFAEQAANSRGEAKLTDIEGLNGVSHVRGSYERGFAYADAATQMLSAVGHLESVLAYREGSEDERGEQEERNAADRDEALGGILDTLKRPVTGVATFGDGECVVNDGEALIAGLPFIGYFAGVEMIATVMVPNEETGRFTPYRAPIANLRAANDAERERVDGYHLYHTFDGNLPPAALAAAQEVDAESDASAAANPPARLKRGEHVDTAQDAESIARGPVKYNSPIPELPTADEQDEPDTKATFSGHGPEPVRTEPLAEMTVPAVERFEPPLHGQRITATTDGHRPLAVEGEYVGTNGDGDPVLRTDNGLEWVVQRGTIRPVPGSGHRQAE